MTTIDSSAIVSSNAQLGRSVVIGPLSVLGVSTSGESPARVGDRVTIGVRAFVGSGASIGDDATLGDGAIVAEGVTVGRGARVAPGAVVLDDVPPNAIVRGNPARIDGYADTPSNSTVISTRDASEGLGVRGAEIVRWKSVRDMRGRLTVCEKGGGLPFVPRRVFTVSSVPGSKVRGEHAHRECQQFLFAAAGSVRALVDDGDTRAEVLLDDPAIGLHMGAMVWGTQYRYSADAVLVVLASHQYDAADYIRDYDEYLDALRIARERSGAGCE